MKARSWLAAWAGAAAVSVAVALVPAKARGDAHSPRTVRYDLDATLDPAAHVVHGKGVMAWKSDAKVPVDTIRLHLYLNAFRDTRSLFMSEAGPDRRKHFDTRYAGSIDLDRFAIPGGADLAPRLRFVHPDGGSDEDRTVAEIPLEKPVQPGEEAVFEVAFTSRLPKVVARSGFGGDFHMVAQWFPKFGVWQDEGEGSARTSGWNCHAYHANTEFFADYGVYDVRLHVPGSYRGQVGATGTRVREERGRDGAITYAYHAEDVHDFAWVAGQNAVVTTETFPGGRGTDRDGRETNRVAAILGRSPLDLALPAVQVTFILRPEHADQLERHRQAVFEALTYMGLWFGPYPYPTLTVVDPDNRAPAGGMEYPTLITGGTSHVTPSRGLSPEFVLVHEFGHQHFYGLLGTNEFEDAWMDEGFNTYATAKVLETAYGPRSMASIETWMGLPVYAEAPLDFPGVSNGLPRSLPFLSKEFVPFGRLGVIRSIGEGLGGDAPDDVAIWPAAIEPSPIAWLRDLPPLTHLDVPNHTLGEHERWRYAEYPDTDVLAGRPGWLYLDSKAYATQSYRRTANLLRTLEGYLGEETMIRVMRTYAERFRFRHPVGADFERVATEVARRDLRWFFDGLLHDSQVIDFGVASIDVDRPRDGPVESTVVVRRYGGARFPTTIRMGLDDGSVRTFVWGLDDHVVPTDDGPPLEQIAPPAPDGQYRWVRLRLKSPHAVAVAETDPERRISLEVDRTNDGRRVAVDVRASTRFAIRTLGWIEQLTTFYGGL